MQHVKCKNQRIKSPNCRNFALLWGHRGGGIERRCVNLHRKFTNNRFCACAVQMLLKMAVNATICSTFKVQYGKSTSSRTTAITHIGHLKQITWLRECAETHKLLTRRALFWHRTFIYLHRRATRSCTVNRQIGVVDSKYVGKIYLLRTGHVIRCMRGSHKRNVNGIHWKALWLITQEWIGLWSSNLVAGLNTWPAMSDNC